LAERLDVIMTGPGSLVRENASSSRRIFSCLTTATCFFFGVAISALGAEESEERPSIEIGWTMNPPEIDGHLDPEEWSDAAHVAGLTQATPDPGEAPTQRTEVWMMTDENHLYIAARLWDTNPEEIVAYAMRRDADTRFDDRFGFTIDPFLDRQNGYFFQVNANGVRRDALIEGQSFASNWDGRWYASTSIDAEGWVVEIALPYSTINFDPATDIWGFNMARGIRRRNEIDRWADPVQERFLTAMGRAGNLVGMKGIGRKLGLRVVPAGTLRRVDDTNDPVDGSDRRHYTRGDPSLDVFLKPIPSITTSLTVNTDFAESEVDARQVNLSRFALFFPEKRDFFLQDALIFRFADLDANGRPFFSRRIGLGPDGEEEGILAGGKITGRIGPFKVGLLDVVLDEHDQIDQQNVLVTRVAANFGESSVGAILTHGDPEGVSNNTVVGGDFNYRDTNFIDNMSFNATAWVQYSTSDPDTGPAADVDAVQGGGLAYGATVEYPNDRIRWALSARSFEDDFAPAIGFVNRTGIRDFVGSFRRRWRPQSSGLETVDTKVEGRLVTELSSATVETGNFTWTPVEMMNPVGDGIRFQYRHRYEFVRTAFDNLSIPVGRYHFDEGQVRVTTSRNRWVGGELFVGHGSFFDGERTRVGSDITFRFSKFVHTSVVYSVDDIRLPGGDELIHLLSARLSIFPTTEISWVTLVQFDNVSDSVDINSRFRWIIEDGREFFVVLNQGLDTSDGLQAGRTEPLVKLQWTFRF
jgi:hypothetical protein